MILLTALSEARFLVSTVPRYPAPPVIKTIIFYFFYQKVSLTKLATNVDEVLEPRRRLSISAHIHQIATLLRQLADSLPMTYIVPFESEGFQTFIAHRQSEGFDPVGVVP